MKVLITGITGFVGSQVARVFLRGGFDVYGIIREDSNLYRVEDILPSINVLQGDLADLKSIAGDIESIKPDICVHLAWYAIPGQYLHSLENINSLTYTLELAKLLGQAGCRKFVGAGTCFEYDLSFGYLSEQTPTKPSTLYAATKVSAETSVRQIGNLTGMQIAWARLFYQYGPFENTRRLVPAVITALLRNEEVKTTLGEQVRDFMHVEDVASALYAIATGDLCGIVNVGSGSPVTVKDIALTIGNILDRTNLIKFGALPYSPTDPMFVCANNSLLKQGTEWAPKYNLEQGIRETISWWINQGGVFNG